MTYMCVAQVMRPGSATVEMFCADLITTRIASGTVHTFFSYVDRTDAMENPVLRMTSSSLVHLQTLVCVCVSYTHVLGRSSTVLWGYF